MIRCTHLAAPAFALLAASALAIDTPPSLETDLQTAKPGDVVTLNFTPGGAIPALNSSPNRFATTGGRLIYSDDPETAMQAGILYQDNVAAGMTRVYLYHVNGASTAMKFSVVIENTGAQTATISAARRALSQPSGNYVAIGRAASQSFYQTPTALPLASLASGQRAILDATLESKSVTMNQLVNAIYDIDSDQPLLIIPVMVETSTNTLDSFDALTKSPDDGNNREGTFTGTMRGAAAPYSYSTTSGVFSFRVGDSNAALTDPPLVGTDADDGSARTLRGNYGVDYTIPVTLNAPDGRALAVLLNPRGGNYGGFVRTSVSPGRVIETLVPLATAQVPSTTSGGVCAIIPLGASPRSVTIELTPAGASSLPIDVLLVPFEPAGLMETWTLE